MPVAHADPSATDLIRSLAPIVGAPPPGDGPPVEGYRAPRGDDYRGPDYRGPDYRGPDYRGPDYRGPDYRGPDYRGPDYRGGAAYEDLLPSRIEGVDVLVGGRRTRVYVDYSRSVDLTVYFEYNSARVTARTRATLDQLGEALASRELRGNKFLIAGHTDASGSDEYNRELSLRRAEAVRDYLVREFRISPARIVVTGWGMSRLKKADEPTSAINRRVEVALVSDRFAEGDRVLRDGRPSRDDRPRIICPSGYKLYDPRRPDLDLDDFGAGEPDLRCRAAR
jgi:outer membrane protein OmpA-like peptidoglycan-associated protein